SHLALPVSVKGRIEPLSREPQIDERKVGNVMLGNIVLGIDGGGTRTRASIVEGEKVLAFAENGSIKHLRVGVEVADTNLRALLKEVFAQSGVKGVRAASVGVASSKMPGVAEWIHGVLQELGVMRVEIVGDEVIALD